MQYLDDYISNVSDDNANIWIHRIGYSTVIRAFVKVGENGEEDEILVSSEDNKIILDELYDMYLTEKTLHNQEVVIDSRTKVDRNTFHPLFARSFDRISKVILKIKDEIYRFEVYRGNIHAHEVTLKKLRFALITLIQVYLTEFSTYGYIIRRYGSVLRKIYIDIWESMEAGVDQEVIDQGKDSERNIIRRESEKVPLSVAVVYISTDNRIIKGHISYPKKNYMIDVKDMTCDCPDFVYRKHAQGLMCKHLIKFQNECKCLVYLNRIVRDKLYNVPCPMGKMLSQAYDEDIKF